MLSLLLIRPLSLTTAFCPSDSSYSQLTQQVSTGRLHDGRTVGEPFVDAVPTCADIVELIAPIHTCTGSPAVNLPNGTEVTLVWT